MPPDTPPFQRGAIVGAAILDSKNPASRATNKDRKARHIEREAASFRNAIQFRNTDFGHRELQWHFGIQPQAVERIFRVSAPDHFQTGIEPAVPDCR